MSKYDDLDASTELEQAVFADLLAALKKRGCTVVHRGTDILHAQGGLPDIEIHTRTHIVTVEVTKARRAAQDREFQAIRDHLRSVKELNPKKKCFCLFSAPSISARTYDSIRDYNEQRLADKVSDMKIMPLPFASLELWLARLKQNVPDLYTFDTFLKMFGTRPPYIDDVRMQKLLVETIFPDDEELVAQIDRNEIETDERTLESLIRDLDNVENSMRQRGVATAQNAIDNLIYLVFLKLYEEKRAADGYPNRLRSRLNFDQYKGNLDQNTRRSSRAIHSLFELIVRDEEFVASGMFTPQDRLVDSLRDDFIENTFIPTFSKYTFLGTKVDALGAVYEVLAERAGKDVKVGQFFTPENIVRFMVGLADLRTDDVVLDPACGTGRFLIHAMLQMLRNLERSSVRSKGASDDSIRQFQCFGADIDLRIAKLAKMNMWIHGDGKSNIFGGSKYNGLLLNQHPLQKERRAGGTFDGAFDVLLTNPPLGDLNYRVLNIAPEAIGRPAVDEQARARALVERFPILPTRDLTKKQLERLALREAELSRQEALYRQRLNAGTQSAAEKSLERVSARLATVRDEAVRLHATILQGESEIEVAGTSMKGGALFLAAASRYLKAVSYPDALPEWRGGRLVIVLDEGILNTADYGTVREFLRRHFYIKAVISLTRDTFVPISRTSTKTSILFAVKKGDPDANQREPIFWAHAANVGIDTRGKICKNDLPEIAEQYLLFRDRVLRSYRGLTFVKSKFDGSAVAIRST